ncbi:hypothetical protein BU23DRAFT_178398 [Bimuria novae-zelandiae CBS 107.79]|uniref:Uncharacterized protein n=1 Tax=Bimuria novae-zelandiae CBS 107.79 TaxID=1447943 RepID=A0A6A5V4T1_9PLEO|nr:hypothetical protein BU23DRAFT_178398 [Bimuria novae-zelandiae CBS 107.79]
MMNRPGTICQGRHCAVHRTHRDVQLCLGTTRGMGRPTSRKWTQPSPDVFTQKRWVVSQARNSTVIRTAGSAQKFSCLPIRQRMLGSSNNTKHLPKCEIPYLVLTVQQQRHTWLYLTGQKVLSIMCFAAHQLQTKWNTMICYPWYIGACVTPFNPCSWYRLRSFAAPTHQLQFRLLDTFQLPLLPHRSFFIREGLNPAFAYTQGTTGTC